MKIVIVGAGKLGVNVAKALLGGDHSVTIIDSEDSVLQKISSQMDVMTINGNAKEIKLLKQLHIDSYDFLIAVTGDDEANLVIASFAKKLGCSKVVARIRDPEHMQQINFIKEALDIDHLVNPDQGQIDQLLHPTFDADEVKKAEIFIRKSVACGIFSAPHA